MFKLTTTILFGFMLTGCTVSSLSEVLPAREPGDLFIICPDGQMYINDGKSACTGFMQEAEKTEAKEKAPE